MKAIYRKQGDNKLYKVQGREVIEINLSSYEQGVIGIAYTEYNIMDMPNRYSKVILKKEFEKYYKEAMIHLLAFHPLTK